MDLAEIRYIAEGFRSDLESVLEEYSSYSTFDFKIFSEIWTRRKFTLVFLGRENEKELSEFTQEVFFVTLGYIKESLSIHLRTGALYVLYALYIKQPQEHKCKIRLTAEQWLDIRNLYEYSVDECITHLLFICLKLMRLRAFHFVACNKLMGPKSTMTWDLVSEQTDNIKTVKSSLAQLNSTLDFEHLSNVHDKYESKLKSFAEKYELPRETELYGNEYEAMGKDFQNLLEAETFDSFLNTSSNSNIDDCIGLRRSQLRIQQFQAECKSKFSTRRKELLGDTEEEEDEADSVCGPLSQLGLSGSHFDSSLFRGGRTRRYRPRRPKRKRGRPKKNATPLTEMEEESKSDIKFENEEEANLKQKPFEKPKRLRWHYETCDLNADENCNEEKK